MKVQLTPAEEAIWQELKSYNWAEADYDEAQIMRDQQKQLTKLLIERNAIPEIRWRYFVEPAYQTGRSNYSRKGIFEKNGTHGDEIYRDPNFTHHLSFMIEGAALSEDFKQRAQQLHDKTVFKSDFPDEFYSQLINRQYVKNLGYNKSAFADEIFKLLIDLGVEPSEATRIKSKI